jgi:hypothetical protein
MTRKVWSGYGADQLNTLPSHENCAVLTIHRCPGLTLVRSSTPATASIDVGDIRERRFMPLFHLNISTRTTIIKDEEGVELSDLAAARHEAIMGARGLMSAAILQGRDISHRHMEVRDEKGALLMRIPFLEAVEPGD